MSTALFLQDALYAQSAQYLGPARIGGSPRRDTLAAAPVGWRTGGSGGVDLSDMHGTCSLPGALSALRALQPSTSASQPLTARAWLRTRPSPTASQQGQQASSATPCRRPSSLGPNALVMYCRSTGCNHTGMKFPAGAKKCIAPTAQLRPFTGFKLFGKTVP